MSGVMLKLKLHNKSNSHRKANFSSAPLRLTTVAKSQKELSL